MGLRLPTRVVACWLLSGVCAGAWELEITPPAVVDESWAPGAAVRGMPSVSSTVVVVASLVNRLRRIGGRRRVSRNEDSKRSESCPGAFVDRPGEGGGKKAELFRRLIGVELQWPRILLTPPLLLPPLLLHDALWHLTPCDVIETVPFTGSCWPPLPRY